MAEKESHLTVRMPRAVHAALIEQAIDECRSLNGQIVYVLRQATGQPDTKARRSRPPRKLIGG